MIELSALVHRLKSSAANPSSANVGYITHYRLFPNPLVIY